MRVRSVTDCPWVLLYVKRWLAAPLQHPDGTLLQRETREPRKDRRSRRAWRTCSWHSRVRSVDGPGVPGLPIRALTPTTRSCIRKTRHLAELVSWLGIAARMEEVGLRAAHRTRRGSSIARTAIVGVSTSTSSFTFLGYAFRPREAIRRQDREAFRRVLAGDQPRGAQGQKRPAPRTAHPQAHKPVAATIWRNGGDSIIAGWMNYYGAHYRSGVDPLLQRVSAPIRGAGLGRSTSGCGPSSGSSGGGPDCSRDSPGLFAHWRWVRGVLIAGEKSPVTETVTPGCCGIAHPDNEQMQVSHETIYLSLFRSSPAVRCAAS